MNLTPLSYSGGSIYVKTIPTSPIWVLPQNLEFGRGGTLENSMRFSYDFISTLGCHSLYRWKTFFGCFTGKPSQCVPFRSKWTHKKFWGKTIILTRADLMLKVEGRAKKNHISDFDEIHGDC